MSLNRIVRITINIRQPPIALASFAVPLTAALLTGPQSTAWDDTYGASTEIAEVTPANWQANLATLGVTSSEDLYIALSQLFGQARQPDLALIGRRADPVAQVSTITVAANPDGTFTASVDGNDYAFPASSDTVTDIRDGLVALINGDADLAVTASPESTDQLELEADVAGVPFTLSVEHSTTPAAITSVLTTPSVGLPEDLLAWRAERDDWYYLLSAVRTRGEIRAAAQAVEPLRKYHVAQINDADAQTAGTVDIGTLLGPTGLNMERTAIYWSQNNDQYVDHAIVGKMAPSPPGAETWANQSLRGVVGTVPTSETALENKRYNWLELFEAARFAMTQGGWSSSGQWTDVVIFADWLHNLMQIRLTELMRNVGKIPYTNAGAELIAAVFRACLEQAADAGGVDRDTIAVHVPDVDSQTEADRGNRHFPNVTWRARLQGAVHSIDAVGDLAP